MSVEYQAGFDPSEKDLLDIKRLVDGPLSEPYSVFCYRYFLHMFPRLYHSARVNSVLIGAVIGRITDHRSRRRGYIAMLAVDPNFRKRGIGRELTRLIIRAMHAEGVDEIVLETEASNAAALALYEQFGFMRDKLLIKYYMSGSDAFRLKLILTTAGGGTNSQSSNRQVQTPVEPSAK